MRIAIIVIACIVLAALVAFFTHRGVKKHRQAKLIQEQTGVKMSRRTVSEWLRAHMPTKRRLIQIYAALLYNANIKGYITGSIYTSATTKYMCVPGLNCYSCPAAVGACPLGALQNALAESSVRAPFYVIGILALFGLAFARTVCGFFCPVGLGQELLYKIRTPKLKKSKVTRVLSYFKYVLLVVLVIIIPLMYALRDVPLPAFCKYICPAGTFGGAIGLLLHPSNAEMFGMLGGQFAWKFSLLVAFIIVSIFVFRFFCRFFCPLGALYGFFNKIALIGVKVQKDKCTNCGKCVAVCKMDTKKVGDHECINCGECIAVCPTKAIVWKGPKLFLRPSDPDIVPTESVSKEQETTESSNAAQEASVAFDTTSISQSKCSACAKPCGKKKRDKNFWFQLSIVLCALALLLGAIIYYNFIDVPKKPTVPPPDGQENIGYEVGQTAPDFTVSLYGSDGKFTLSDSRGKLTVVNFWATWCTPCVNEIPHFDKLVRDHPELSVIAIHGSSTRDVNKFIEDNWAGHALTFAQDNLDGSTCLTYSLLGGQTMWPLTVIIDGDGKVVYNDTKSFHSYEDLEKLVMSFAVVD